MLFGAVCTFRAGEMRLPIEWAYQILILNIRCGRSWSGAPRLHSPRSPWYPSWLLVQHGVGHDVLAGGAQEIFKTFSIEMMVPPMLIEGRGEYCAQLGSLEHGGNNLFK